MQVYFYDENHFYTNTEFLSDEEIKSKENFTTIAPADGLINPCWNSEINIWEERASKNEIIESKLNYENKNYSVVDIFLILGAYMKGGIDMFFEVMLNFWIEGKIDTAYLDKAVGFKLITKEQADFIRLTPRAVEE